MATESPSGDTMDFEGGLHGVEDAEIVLQSATTIVETCMEIARHENVLIVTDALSELVARSLFIAANRVSDRVLLVMMPTGKRHGDEPPIPVADLMRKQDVILAPTRYSLTHTRARIAASREGARIATMPGVTLEMFVKGGMTANFAEIREKIRSIYSKIRRQKRVRVTTKAGTDIEFLIDRSRWSKEDSGICHRPGMVTNLPAGKLFGMPKEGTMNGTIVIDGSFEASLLSEPLRLEVRNGMVTSIEGGSEADRIRDMYEEASSVLPSSQQPDVWTVAEFGFGLNPSARIIGNVLEDEKSLGSCYFSIGDNHALGGRVQCGIHVSGVMRNPTLVLGDNLTLIEDGDLKIS